MDKVKDRAKLQQTIPEDRVIETIANHLEVIGDPTRLKILYVLSIGEAYVSELAEFTGLSLPAVSHHLRILKDKMLVIKKKTGVKVFYRLMDQCLLDVLAIARRHIEEDHIA